MEKSNEKEVIKLGFAVALEKALSDSDLKSFGELASASGLEPAHVQRILSGTVGIALTTIVSLADGFGISLAELFAYYDGVTKKDISNYNKKKGAAKRNKK